MKKNVTIALMIMCGFSLIFSMSENTNDVILIDSIMIISILIIEIFDFLFKRVEKVVRIFEISIITITLLLNIKMLIYIIPIFIFKLGKNSSIFYIIIINCCYISFFKGIDYFNISLYIVIINLYLYEVKRWQKDRIHLKEKNKSKRDENYKIKEELDDLERYLKQNAIILKLKERNFMAQKLHDHLGHRITSSLMQLEVTKETMDSNKDLSKKYLNTAIESLRTGMEEIRGILKDVKPKDRLIGIESIKEELLHFQYSSRIKTNLKVKGDLEKIDLRLWGIIEENLKESLTNASKYSKASNIEMSILIYNKILRVEIKDNGIGSTLKGEGLGISGIRKRVEEVCGRVEYFNDNGFVINTIFNI